MDFYEHKLKHLNEYYNVEKIKIQVELKGREMQMSQVYVPFYSVVLIIHLISATYNQSQRCSGHNLS